MPHAYTEDQQAPRTLTRPLPGGEVIEQPATKGKAEGEMLKAEVLPPEVITAAVDELTRDRSAMSRFSGQVNLNTN